MYHDRAGAKLTLYVSNEAGNAAPDMDGGNNQETAFRFAEGPVNVFYRVNGPFGYAISAHADRAEMARVSGEVYRQLGTGR